MKKSAHCQVESSYDTKNNKYGDSEADLEQTSSQGGVRTRTRTARAINEQQQNPLLERIEQQDKKSESKKKCPRLLSSRSVSQRLLTHFYYCNTKKWLFTSTFSPPLLHSPLSFLLLSHSPPPITAPQPNYFSFLLLLLSLSNHLYPFHPLSLLSQPCYHLWSILYHHIHTALLLTHIIGKEKRLKERKHTMQWHA